MVDEYMSWTEKLGDKGMSEAPTSSSSESVEGTMHLHVIDVFREFLNEFYFLVSDPTLPEAYSFEVKLCTTDKGIPAAILRHGLIPCSPFTPTLAITIRVLELYRVSHLRCPHLAIQPFVKGLCDLHGVPSSPYLFQQFSICYDLYLRIREQVKIRVDEALARDSETWRLRNVCPACTYWLLDEEDLIFKMLVTMDGNDSLKRILRRETVEAPMDEEAGPPTVGQSMERPDSRKVGGNYYLTREVVDRWAKERIAQEVANALEEEPEEEENPCEGRWSNMINEFTARMWGIFDETGIFLALCRHGFVLVVADMVQSGEL